MILRTWRPMEKSIGSDVRHKAFSTFLMVMAGSIFGAQCQAWNLHVNFGAPVS